MWKFREKLKIVGEKNTFISTTIGTHYRRKYEFLSNSCYKVPTTYKDSLNHNFEGQPLDMVVYYCHING